MKTFIIPGFSEKNRAWVLEVVANLKMDGEIRPIFWEHWEDDNQKAFDAPEKANDIIDILGKDKAMIIAKSIGTYVAMFLLEKISEKIEKLVLCGIPINDLSDTELDRYRILAKFPSQNILCFQNESDSHGSYGEVAKFLENINSKIEVVKKPRSDHDYPFYDDFNSALRRPA